VPNIFHDFFLEGEAWTNFGFHRASITSRLHHPAFYVLLTAFLGIMYPLGRWENGKIETVRHILPSRSKTKFSSLKYELKKTIDRFEGEELVIERNPELFSVAIIMARNKS
jgi:hypothetical protein